MDIKREFFSFIFRLLKILSKCSLSQVLIGLKIDYYLSIFFEFYYSMNI